MTIPPLDLNQLNTYEQARLAAETLDMATIGKEVHDLESNIQDLAAGTTALTEILSWIDQGNVGLIPAAGWVAGQLENMASNLCGNHVELCNKLHYWAEIEETKP